ncbi:hypothetical protein [Metabacillus fastidiosus]|uniref:hypothetical protein n=1 Tax=Metabacillus fastidiosus TaxID=1458 RepID=UPI003D29C02E
MSNREMLLNRLYEEIVKICEVYEVKVTEDKSCMELFADIVEKYDRELCIRSLNKFGHISNGIVGNMNNVVRERLKSLDEKEKAVGEATPTAVTNEKLNSFYH